MRHPRRRRRQQPLFDSGWVETLREAGIEVHASLPVGVWRTFFTRTDLRNHRKILVIDSKIGYTGSFNLADPRFFKKIQASANGWTS